MKKRLCFDNVLRQKNQRKISIIIGPRQAGKTTILKELHKKLGGVFFDIDVFSQYSQVASYEDFINTLKLKGYREKQKQFFYVFLDEFQRYADLSLVLKNIYDNHPNIKIFASGSSSLAIKHHIQESLAGRKLITQLYPLNFQEYLIFKDKAPLWDEILKLRNIASKNYFTLLPKVKKLWLDFLVFGGYPEVVLSRDSETKRQVLESIFDLYIKKDLVEYLNIEKIRSAKILIQKLAVNHGALINFSELGSITSLDTKTVQNYAETLQETFLINIIRPFFTNKNKEISKMPKIYFLDNGVRNYFLNNFNPLDIRNDAGVLFESYYLGELLKSGETIDHIKYYRSKQKVEVDFVLDKISQLIPLELKFKHRIKANDTEALKKFAQDYEVEQAYLVNTQEINQQVDPKLIDCFTLEYT